MTNQSLFPSVMTTSLENRSRDTRRSHWNTDYVPPPVTRWSTLERHGAQLYNPESRIPAPANYAETSWINQSVNPQRYNPPIYGDITKVSVATQTAPQIVYVNSDTSSQPPTRQTNPLRPVSMSRDHQSERQRSHIKLGSFSGDTALHLFLKRFSICQVQNEWNQADSLNQLICALTGQAGQLICENDADDVLTADDLIAKLRARFGTEDQQSVFQAQLTARRQKTGEDLATLAADVRRLVNLSFPGRPSKHSELVGIKSYLDALTDRCLSLKVRETDPKDLEQAIRTSLRFHSYQMAEADSLRDSAKIPGRVRAVKEDAAQQNTNQRTERRLNNLESQFRQPTNDVTYGYPPEYPNFRPPQRQDYDRPWMRNRRNQRSQPNRRQCHACGSYSHLIRWCPYRNTPPAEYLREYDQSAAAVQNDGNAFVRHVPGFSSAYLPIRLDGRELFALLDSGCQPLLCPLKYVKPRDVRPTNRTLLAANNTHIEVSGEAMLKFQIGGQSFETLALLTPQLQEVILGFEWMRAQGLQWDIGGNSVQINGIRIQTHIRASAASCRRVAAAGDVTIPPFSELNVDAYAILPNLLPRHNQWATQPTVLDTGLIIAGTLLPDRTTDLTLRVMNPTNKTLKLKKGARCDLEEVTLVERSVDELVTNRCAAIRHDAVTDVENVLRPLWENVDADVPDSIREQLKTILLQHRSAFSLGEWDLGFTDVLQHEIDTGSEPPVRQALRRQPLMMLPIIDEQVKLMLQQGLIEDSFADWASNVVIVRKKDGTPRFCIDYRALNNKTKKDSYPLPLIAECLDTLGGATWFSTFDLRAGYHQVAVHPKDRHKTTFVTRQGSYQFRALPFGLCNAPNSFSRLMNLVMSGLNFAICLIYLDDIIVFASDLETHLSRLVQVLVRLGEVNLKLKPSKCHLLRREVLFLGHVVSRNGIATDSTKIEAVESWPTPQKLKEVRAFLGLCSYYRKFVSDFALIARPLHALTKKETRFCWSEECDAAFVRLKQKLIEAPILALPNDTGTYVLDTDASGSAVGGVLSQVQNGVERVICYGSRLCSTAEQNYDVTKRELLAIVHFLKVYRPYLLGKKFLLRTDHSALQWLRKTPLPIGQQARWLTVIEEYDFEVQHRPGRNHENADALSRRPYAVNVIRDAELPPGGPLDTPDDWSNATIAAEQEADKELGWVMQKRRESTNAPSHEELRSQSATVKLLVAQWPQLDICDGLLTRCWIDAEDNHVRWRQMIPSVARRSTLIRLAHEGMTGGHLGLRRTMAQLQRRAYWPGWQEDVQLQLKQCNPCARYFRGKPKRQGLLQNMVVGEVGEVLALDLTGPHVLSSSGHRYILTIIDHYSRWAEAIPVRNQEAVTVAKVLVDQWISRYGCPLQILTDQGPCFEATLFKDLCRLLGIDKVRTSPYKPSTNGLIERFHRTLNTMIAKVVAQNQRNWTEHLPLVMAAYRASIHQSTGFTPNKLFLNKELCMPLDLVLGDCYAHENAPPCHEYVYNQGKQMQTVFAIARENMQTQAETRAFRYNLRARPSTYQVGQIVWFYYPRHRQNVRDKWASWFTGPYRVEKQVSSVLYQIRKSPRSQARLVYVDRLKPFFGETPAVWNSENESVETDIAPIIVEREEEDPTADAIQRPRRQIQPPARYGFEDSQ